MHVEEEEELLLRSCSLCFCERGSLKTFGTCCKLGWLAREPQGSTCLCISGTGLGIPLVSAAVTGGFWGADQRGLHVYTAGTLPIELSPKYRSCCCFLTFFFFFFTQGFESRFFFVTLTGLYVQHRLVWNSQKSAWFCLLSTGLKLCYHHLSPASIFFFFDPRSHFVAQAGLASLCIPSLLDFSV